MEGLKESFVGGRKLLPVEENAVFKVLLYSSIELSTVQS